MDFFALMQGVYFGGVDVLIIVLFLTAMIMAYVFITDMNNERKEARGICKTTGGTCTSPTGCTCGDDFD